MLQSKASKKAKPTGARDRANKPVRRSQKRPRAAHKGTKQDAVLALLRQPGGANITAIVKATGWQQHSVRGFLAGVVRKKLQLKLESNKVDGDRVYYIAERRSA
jgi:hypothetical protein